MPADEGAAYVYFIEWFGYVKIGWSVNVARRVSMFAMSHPVPPKLRYAAYGGQRAESMYHERFRHLRVKGEWFKEEGELAAFLAEQDAHLTPIVPLVTEGR